MPIYYLRPGYSNRPRYAAQRVMEVDDADIDDLELVLAAPRSITGRVILPEGRWVPPALFVGLIPCERIVLLQGSLNPVAPDGTFHTEPLPGGDYDVTTGSLNESHDLYVSAIRMGDEDVLAKGLHIGDAAPAPLEIVLAANGGTLQAAVANDKSDPVPQAHVMLLPDPPLRATRVLRGDCTTDASGGCSIRGIASGDYHAFAFVDNPPVDVDDATIKATEKYGKSVTIAAGGQAQLTLEPVPNEEE